MPLGPSAPAKVILLGEWAVLDGGTAIAVPLKARLHLHVRDLRTGDEIIFRSDSVDEKKEATLNATGDLSDPFFDLARKVLLELRPNLDGCRDREYTFKRDWKLSEGLGSSSAVIATLLKAFPPPQLEKAPRAAGPTDHEALAHWSFGLEILHRHLSPRASGLDLAVQIFDAAVLMRDKNPETLRDLEIPKDLQLIHTGEKLSTQDALRKVEMKGSVLKEIAASSDDFIHDRDWERALRRHAQALESLGVVPRGVCEAFADWQARGWTRASKTTGAGGGDALLVLLRPEFRVDFENDLRARGWYFNESGWAL